MIVTLSKPCERRQQHLADDRVEVRRAARTAPPGTPWPAARSRGRPRHRLAPRLPPVARHQDRGPAVEHGEVAGSSSGRSAADDVEQRVDHGVAGDDDVGRVDAVREQVAPREGCRREVQRGELRGEPAVHLLRERVVAVVGAQARLDVEDRHLLVERGQAGDERRGRVALHHDRVGSVLAHRLA